MEVRLDLWRFRPTASHKQLRSPPVNCPFIHLDSGWVSIMSADPLVGVGKVENLTASVALALLAKYDVGLERATRAWLSALLPSHKAEIDSSEVSLHSLLKSGVVLCEYASVVVVLARRCCRPRPRLQGSARPPLSRMLLL